MSLKLTLLFFISCACIASAAPRQWKSADAARSLSGEFMSRDETSVTIRRKRDRKKFTIPFTKLHPDEIKWLDENHPIPPPPGQEFFNPAEAYKALAFGDSMNETIDKLEKCEHVKATMARTLFGRGGINGVFRTVHKMGGLEASLYYDWDDANKLKEISVRTSEQPASSFKEKLMPCYNDCVKLLTARFGEPTGAIKAMNISQIPNKGISFTSHWKLKEGGSILCGAGHEDGKYLIIVRFTTEEH